MKPWANIASLNREQTLQLQNQKLHSFINQYLYPFSPHYHQLFDDNGIDPKSIKTIDDLQKIPFISKANFVQTEGKEEVFRDFALQPDKEKIKKYWPASKLISFKLQSLYKGQEFIEDKLFREFRPVFMTFTTGTTSKPVPFLYSLYDIENLHLSGARMLKLFDISRTEQLVSMFPFAPHLAFWQVVCGGFSACAMVLSTGGGKAIGTDGNVAAILKMKPSVLLGVPSYVYHVLRVAKENGHQMPYLKKIVLGAARVTQAFKQKLVEICESMGATDVSVFGTYGFTESRCAWAECPTSLDISSGYHLYPDKEIFEVVDPKTGEVKGEGEDGELVYTSLDSRASSLIRYRTGDFVRGGITYEPCPHCKRTVPRISSDITRLSDVKDLQLSKIKGSLVNLSNFDATLSEVGPIKEWQVEIRKRNNDPFDVDELVVYVCADDNSDNDQLAEEIKKAMSMSTEVTPNEVSFINMEDMVKRLELETSNKERRILDTRPKS